MTKARLEAVEAQLNRERETVDDLRKRLDAEQEERRHLQRRLMPPEKPQEELTVVEELRKDLSIPVVQIAKRLGVSRATFYAYFPGARSRSLA